MLGRPYSMTGRVIHGAALGRTLGFPRSTWRRFRRQPLPSRRHGRLRRPHPRTRTGRSERRRLDRRQAPRSQPTGAGFETHVFDWSGSAYGRIVKVEFVERLRREEVFRS